MSPGSTPRAVAELREVGEHAFRRDAARGGRAARGRRSVRERPARAALFAESGSAFISPTQTDDPVGANPGDECFEHPRWRHAPPLGGRRRGRCRRARACCRRGRGRRARARRRRCYGRRAWARRRRGRGRQGVRVEARAKHLTSCWRSRGGLVWRARHQPPARDVGTDRLVNRARRRLEVRQTDPPGSERGPLDEHGRCLLQEREHSPHLSRTQDLVGQVPLNLDHDVARSARQVATTSLPNCKQHFDEVPHRLLSTVSLAAGPHRSGGQGSERHADPVGHFLSADLDRRPLPREELEVHVQVNDTELLPR